MCNALRDRGAPTWRDVDDLAPEPTEQELVATLKDPNTAGAVMLISPEVADSPIIQRVEAHRIFQRHAARDGFLVKPVLIQLGYGEANEVLGSPAGFQDLGDWNLHKLDDPELDDSAARTVACDVLSERLATVATDHQGKGLSVGLFSRRAAAAADFTLLWDFSPYFDGRESPSGTFDTIEQALADSASALAAYFNEAAIAATGYASLPLGVLFGAVFSPLTGFHLSWQQVLAGRPKDTWSLAVDVKHLQLEHSLKLADPRSEDLVLALGISAHIEHAVAEYLEANCVRPRAAMHLSIETGSVPPGHRLSAGEGLSVVYQAINAVRQFKDDYGLARVRLHLFLACPLAMAVLLGQVLNTLTQCVLYEHDPSGNPAYRRVHAFNPSGFTHN